MRNVRRVMIVEDNDTIRDLWVRVFAKNGYVVRTAADGIAAIELLREDEPDIVVLDLVLPRLNGIEVVKTLRQEAQFARLPIVVTTGTMTNPLDFGNFKPVCILRKPFVASSLIGAVERLLKTRDGR